MVALNWEAVKPFGITRREKVSDFTDKYTGKRYNSHAWRSLEYQQALKFVIAISKTHKSIIQSVRWERIIQTPAKRDAGL